MGQIFFSQNKTFFFDYFWGLAPWKKINNLIFFKFSFPFSKQPTKTGKTGKRKKGKKEKKGRNLNNFWGFFFFPSKSTKPKKKMSKKKGFIFGKKKKIALQIKK